MTRPRLMTGLGLWLPLVRLYQRVGSAGLLGLGLLAAAVAVAAVAWRQQEDFARDVASDGASQATATLASSSAATSPSSDTRPAPVRWPSAKDVPLLLTRIERAAVERGLGWPQADYRFNAATAEGPDSLEVHCVLKGPYRSVRGFMTALLLDMPTLTLREFSVSRSSTDAENVDAKLSVVVYLSSGAGSDPESLR